MRDCNEARKDMTVEEMLALIREAPPGPWPTKKHLVSGKWQDDPEHTWHCWPNAQEAMRRLAREFIDERLPKEPRGTYKGRGIIVAGGACPVPHRGLPHGYFPSIWVQVNKLRRMGCELPVQLWYMGDMEMDPYLERLLEPLGVECIDARTVALKHPCRILCGWELKPFAALHCPFEEVLFLDADNVPVNKPVDLLFSSPGYLQLGSMFWPDYSHWILDKGVFDVFGITPYRREQAFESGQFMIHKGRCWSELRLATWYAEYSDFTFGHVYGDKEVFHLAWRKLGTEYAMPAQAPGWEGDVCIVQHDEEGTRILHHRCQDKWRLNGGNRFVKSLEDEQVHHDICKELRGVWNGKLWDNPAPTRREREVARALEGAKFKYRRLPKGDFPGDERDIVLEAGWRVGQGSAECETRWSVNEVAVEGGPPVMTLAVCREEKPTFICERGADGVWRGEWLEHERCGVELVPVEVKRLTPQELAGEIAGLVRKNGYHWRELEVSILDLLRRDEDDGIRGAAVGAREGERPDGGRGAVPVVGAVRAGGGRPAGEGAGQVQSVPGPAGQRDDAVPGVRRVLGDVADDGARPARPARFSVR
jgi:hypothetical protein